MLAMVDAIRAVMQEAELTAIMAIKAMLATVLTEATETAISAVASAMMAVTIAFATIIIPTTSTAATLADSETVVEPVSEADRIPVVEALAEEVLVEADPQADGDFIYYLFNYYLPFITFFFIN